jgi:hypothetical protein
VDDEVDELRAAPRRFVPSPRRAGFPDPEVPEVRPGSEFVTSKPQNHVYWPLTISVTSLPP